MNNQVDHILVRNELRYKVHTDCFFNFVSDHKCIILRKSQYAVDDVIQRESNESKETLPSTKAVDNTTMVAKNLSLLSLNTLNGNQWLNDEVVDSYLEILMRDFDERI